MHCFKYKLFILWFIFGIYLPAIATTMFELSLEDLSREAGMIVEAKVTTVVTQWDKDSSIIYTYVRMNIQDDLIGEDEDNEIIIKQPGGQIGSSFLHVEGTTPYTVGEEDVLFLFKDRKNPGTYQTLGMYQGKYQIFIDDNNVKRVKQASGCRTKLLKRDPQAVVRTGNYSTLEEFKKTIIKYINSGN